MNDTNEKTCYSVNSIKVFRRIYEILDLSILNVEILTTDIGEHDFNESVYRLYRQLKTEISTFNYDDNYLSHDEWFKIQQSLSTYIQKVLLFLMKYHKKLWKRFDVPRTIFYNVGGLWNHDIKILRLATSNYMKEILEVLENCYF